MQEKVGIDASGLFAFFQIQKPGSNVSNLAISSNLKRVYYEFLLKKVDLVIPVPALSELMYKAFMKGKINEFNSIIAVYQAMDNVYIVDWEIEMLEEMGEFLDRNEPIINQYFKTIKKKPEIFD
jgi:hypothetical protein